MIKGLARLLGLALLLTATAVSRAETVRGLYSARVPVANQSTAALASAARQAMAEVLVKVSGSNSVLQNPIIVAALPEARGRVQQYAYSRDEADKGALYARFEFDDSYVTRLVTDAGVPLWTANRPAVLVWIVVEEATGRQFVNWETRPGLAAQLTAEFERRGVPVQVPLYDLADSAALSPEDVWYLNGMALREASSRYNLQDVMAGRLATLSGGLILGDWAYIYGDDRIDRSVSTKDTRVFFRDGAAVAAEAMAGRYAVAPSFAGAGGVSLSVAGVASYADYAAIVSWLESLELIDHANVQWISGDLIELRLQAQADEGQLAAIIELNERLVPVPGASANRPLSYQWRN